MPALPCFEVKEFSRLIILLLSMAMAACGGGGSSNDRDTAENSTGNSEGDPTGGSDNTAPTISGLEFIPANPKTNSEITAVANFSDNDGDAVQSSYSWKVNETFLGGADSNKLAPRYFKAGDNVTVTVTASDGTDETVASLSVKIANTPPSISDVKFQPANPNTTSEITAIAIVTDSDGDPVNVSYSWSVNESTVESAHTHKLASTYFKKDDNVTVTVTASDGTDETTAPGSVTIADSPPIITVSGEPDTLPFDSTANFVVTVHDPDNDPYEYRFLARPNGMTIDAMGTVTWSPRDPLFTVETDFAWEIAVVQGEFSNSVGGKIRVVDELRRPPLSRSGPTLPTMNSPDMMIPGDFNGDGNTQILICDGAQRLSMVAFNGTDYEQNWVYPFAISRSGSNILSLHARESAKGSQSEFILGTRNYNYNSAAEIIVIDGATRAISRINDVDGEAILAIDSEDLDGDGEIEYSVLVLEQSESTMHLAVLDAETLAEEWRSPSIDLGRSMVLGQFDNDSEPEIALAGGYIYGFEGGEYKNLWAYAPGFGTSIKAGDLDADGFDEIVGLSYGVLQVFSPARKSLLITDGTHYVKDFLIGESSPSPGEEILVLSSRENLAKSISLTSDSEYHLSVNWTHIADGPYAFNLMLGDLDNDGVTEFSWVSGWGEKLHVASTGPAVENEWKSPLGIDSRARFSGGKNIQPPHGEPSLLFFQGSSGIEFVPNTGYVSLIHQIAPSFLQGEAEDIDQDGISEIFYASGKNVGTYSLLSDGTNWTAPALPSNAQALASALINDDTYIDFSVATETGYIYTFDAFNQTLIDGFETDYSPISLAMEDIEDNNGSEFIIASMFHISIYGETPTGVEELRSIAMEDLVSAPELSDIQAYPWGMEIVDMTVGDVNRDGIFEIFVASEAPQGYWILVFAQNLKLLAHYPVQGEVTALQVAEFGDSHYNLVVALTPENVSFRGHTTIYTLDPMSGKEVSRSPELLGVIEPGNIFFADTNGDGLTELSYSTRLGMHVTR